MGRTWTYEHGFKNWTRGKTEFAFDSQFYLFFLINFLQVLTYYWPIFSVFPDQSGG